MLFLSANDSLNPDIITDNPDFENYILKPHKRPKLKINKTENTLIITRSNGWFKRKQLFTFTVYLEKGFDVLATNFLLFFNKFIKHEREINDTQYLKDLIYLFEHMNIFILPRITPYIQEKMVANQHMYIRFITMVNSLEVLINPEVISYIKFCYLKSILKFNCSYLIPNEQNKYKYVDELPNIDSLHEYLDMITLFPWSYLFFVYKFNKYSDFRSMINE